MTAKHRSPSRPRSWRRAAALITGALAVALAGAGATAASAAPVQPAASRPGPAAVAKVRPARVVDGCNLNFGGRYVSTTIINDGGSNHYANLTITQHNALPRRINFAFNRITDVTGGNFRGITTLAAGETQTWVAVGVWIGPGTAWAGSAHDKRGNSDWTVCYGIGS